MPITSGKGTNCPYCSVARFWTDVPADYESIKKEFPETYFELDQGVDVGRWSERKDIRVNKIYPTMCKSCGKVYVARLGVLNGAAIQAKATFNEFNEPTEEERRYSITLPRTRWGYVGLRVDVFCDMVRAIQNQFLRDSVVRKLEAAGWRFSPLAGP
ncbi:MAG: hypothetical protein ACREB9_07565 [Thermoplasmata archaeon]